MTHPRGLSFYIEQLKEQETEIKIILAETEKTLKKGSYETMEEISLDIQLRKERDVIMKGLYLLELTISQLEEAV